jgi:hypothetical protein
MVKELTNFKMGTDMKVNGRTIKNMVRGNFTIKMVSCI